MCFDMFAISKMFKGGIATEDNITQIVSIGSEMLTF